MQSSSSNKHSKKRSTSSLSYRSAQNASYRQLDDERRKSGIPLKNLNPEDIPAAGPNPLFPTTDTIPETAGLQSGKKTGDVLDESFYRLFCSF